MCVIKPITFQYIFPRDMYVHTYSSAAPTEAATLCVRTGSDLGEFALFRFVSFRLLVVKLISQEPQWQQHFGFRFGIGFSLGCS